MNEALKTAIDTLGAVNQYDPAQGYTYDNLHADELKEPNGEHAAETNVNQVEINSMHKALFNTVTQG